MAQQLLHRLLLAISFDNPNGTATVTQTSLGNFFWQSQWHSDCYTDFFWQFLLTIPMAQRPLHRLLLAIFFDNPSGTATVTQTSFGNFFWQSQWHSDCYTDFCWQFLLTIPMAQRPLHRLLLAISFDNPNGTATVTQTSFGNFFWQSQWHSDCYTDFFWQFLLTIPMAQRLLHRLLLTIFFDNPNGTATVTQTSFGNPNRALPNGTLAIRSAHKSAKQKVYCTQQQYRGHTSLLRKHKECKRKRKSNKSTAHNSKTWCMNYRRIRKNHQNTVGTQANDKSTKNAHESAKATKVLRTTAKHDAWTVAGYEKNHQNTVVTQAYDESSKNANESAKATKVLRTTAKMIDELLPHTSKSHQNIGAHKLITKAQSIPTKNPKATKYCAQQQKWCMNYCRIGKKSWKHSGHAEWYDFSPSDTT